MQLLPNSHRVLAYVLPIEDASFVGFVGMLSSSLAGEEGKEGDGGDKYGCER